jgi:2-isopropylmalate synthase
MPKAPAEKYRPFPPIHLPNRRWPERAITQAPLWCSVDLRDGNQALPEPMGHERKRRMWETLVRVGFKQIEVGFPSASQIDFDFVRWLIEKGQIPEDVTIQVLTQAREHLIRRTFAALQGAKRAICHIYNSTSELQRRVVFKMERDSIKEIAREGTLLIKRLCRETATEIVLEYSPESFTGTELEFAVDVCGAVRDAWEASSSQPVILNLPATVEMSTPNTYADQVEWFARELSGREAYLLSVHPHNDRGTAVAAAELALMAGADRVEGTLFGNGERTGNVDVVTMALNMLTQGVDPGLDMGNIGELVATAEYCNRLPVHCRHPYAGELVFTAFSGSHQDAIKKGLKARAESQSQVWEVPYLPIDPDDIGRKYEAVIRINSQSGKGGVAYVMEHDFGLALPRNLQIEFSKVIQALTDDSESEVSPAEIWKAFEREYLEFADGFALSNDAIELRTEERSGQRTVSLNVACLGRVEQIRGHGNGPIDALVHALASKLPGLPEISSYSEHGVGQGADAKAVAYIEMSLCGSRSFGVGLHESILTASVLAVLSAVNRILRQRRELLMAPAACEAS